MPPQSMLQTRWNDRVAAVCFPCEELNFHCADAEYTPVVSATVTSELGEVGLLSLYLIRQIVNKRHS